MSRFAGVAFSALFLFFFPTLSFAAGITVVGGQDSTHAAHALRTDTTGAVVLSQNATSLLVTSNGQISYVGSGCATSTDANGFISTSGTGCSVLFAPTRVACWANLALTYAYGTSGSAPSVKPNIIIQFSPDGVNWESWNSTLLSPTPFGAVTSLGINSNARAWIQVIGGPPSSTTSTTYNFWLTGNNNFCPN